MFFSFLRSPVRRIALVALVLVALSAAIIVPAMLSHAPSALAASPALASQPNFGPNVFIFTPTMPLSDIQAKVDAIASQQIPNQFGQQRYALLFAPGTYGTSTAPLNFQVGYYTMVAGLGQSPGDVVINGSIYVRNQCDASNSCIALNNFWRSLSNLTINVTTPNFGCYSGEFWAVSQAAPMRRVHVNGPMTLMDYCTSPSFASGGFIADSQIDGNIVSGSQQQWVTRNSVITSWSNGVWNQVFAGVTGAPAQCFPAQSSCGGPYTTLATSPVTREAPYLYVDAGGNYNVFVPAVQRNSAGTTWATGATQGTSISIKRFYIASPSDSAARINDALDSGKNVILTPGIYHLKQSIQVERPGTVVLGLGFATLVPDNGNVAMKVDSTHGVSLSGIIFDAGPRLSPTLLQVGDEHEDNHGATTDPTTLHDVFFRIGGAQQGRATKSLVVNSNNVILDDIWAWRADHGNGVGWTTNTADTGVIVNGNNVTAYGLFV
ncbi:MAG: adenylyl cyclase, partial [Ktedonobacterales bacterium]|nr:adenylyl cyclase [Ktedonobacterales bacterium]